MTGMRYLIQIEERLGADWSDWFTGLTIVQSDDRSTTLIGTFRDQAELYGTIHKLRDLSLTLVCLVRVGAAIHTEERGTTRDASN